METLHQSAGKPIAPPTFKSLHFSQKYYQSLDGLRALSILIVITAHLSKTYGFDIVHPIFNYFIRHGNLGVAIFFVISGFLITTLLLKENAKTHSIDLWNFYRRRALRILPVIVLYFVILIILNNVFKLKITFLSFAGPMLFLGNFHNFNESLYFSHFWSLAYEEQFYFIIPFFLKFKLKSYSIFVNYYLIFLPIIILVYGIMPYSNEGLSHALRFFYNFYPLFVGSFFATMISQNRLKFEFITKKGGFILYLLFVIVFTINFEFIGNVKTQYINVLLNFINSYFIFLLIIFSIYAKHNNLMYKTLNNVIVVKVGVLSYSLYIFQQLFATRLPWRNYSQLTDNLFLNMLALFLVAYLSYTYYEKFFLKLKEKFAR